MTIENFTHDPSEYIRGMQSLLINDKKKLAFFFGAGTSLAKKNTQSKTVPAIKAMTTKIVSEITEAKEKSAIEDIANEIGAESFNIETLLSNIEQKYCVIGNGTLNGLNKAELKNLIDRIKEKIRLIVSVHHDVDPINQIQTDFTEWINRAERKHPIEIFTTNYDYLFEIGLEQNNLPYYDGFTGSFEPFFNAESVSDFDFLPKQIKLWKIHGSLGWKFDVGRKKVIRKSSDSSDILIYPSILKYANSKKQPYEALMDRMSNFLKQDDAVMITCGYSFKDEHINERLITALQSSSTSIMIALFFDDEFNEAHELAKIAKANSKITIFSNKSAVIGCKWGTWKIKTEPSKDDILPLNLYFDEDAPIINSEINEVKKGGEIWTGNGKLKVTDFSKMVVFLSNMIVSNNSGEIKR